jgi:hypothetical protein
VLAVRVSGSLWNKLAGVKAVRLTADREVDLSTFPSRVKRACESWKSEEEQVQQEQVTIPISETRLAGTSSRPDVPASLLFHATHAFTNVYNVELRPHSCTTDNYSTTAHKFSSSLVSIRSRVYHSTLSCETRRRLFLGSQAGRANCQSPRVFIQTTDQVGERAA